MFPGKRINNQDFLLTFKVVVFALPSATRLLIIFVLVKLLAQLN